jgi:AcrR family transcriptional regulator
MDHRATPRRRRKLPEGEHLGRDAWLDAAGAAAAEGGFDVVRVLTLAKRLGVTRGSFYWHFTDHSDLVVSFLDRWRDRRLAEIAYLRANRGDRETELHRIFRLVLSEPARNTRQMRVELAVRDFARRDAYAARIVAEVDRTRIDYSASLLERVMTDRRQARDLALLLYVVTIGGRVVLADIHEGEAAIARIDNLVAGILAARGRWPGWSAARAPQRAGAMPAVRSRARQ